MITGFYRACKLSAYKDQIESYICKKLEDEKTTYR